MSETETIPKKTILVAEDDQYLARALVDKLERAGFMVIMVSDGEAAIKQLLDKKIDLALLDLIMPKKNGFDVLAELKGKAVPVIVLSNLGQEDDVAQARSLGAIDYFVKADISLKDVIKKVEEHLGISH